MKRNSKSTEKKRKLAPLDGPHGVDRFTSNGYGLIFNGEKVEPIAEDENIDEIEEE